tara:strand:+ start:77 stop:487 length:411 start_codon:yes stop_codon:yes gene_type:complete
LEKGATFKIQRLTETVSLLICADGARLERRQFGLELGDALLEFFDDGGVLLGGEARLDVLRSVDVPGVDVENKDALGAGLVAGVEQAFEQLRVVLDDFGATPYFDAAAVGVVHQEDEGLVVFVQNGRSHDGSPCLK